MLVDDLTRFYDDLFERVAAERRARLAVQSKLAADVKAEAHHLTVALVQDWPGEADEALLTLMCNVAVLDDMAAGLARGD